mmetsp:Transcript_13572/g.41990  ORF Transcript_13572/g.41990 Transcript_13572/m.41990 type:complete len:311 (+) Transcript_13572:773-1705(+)
MRRGSAQGRRDADAHGRARVLAEAARDARARPVGRLARARGAGRGVARQVRRFAPRRADEPSRSRRRLSARKIPPRRGRERQGRRAYAVFCLPRPGVRGSGRDGCRRVRKLRAHVLPRRPRGIRAAQRGEGRESREASRRAGAPGNGRARVRGATQAHGGSEERYERQRAPRGQAAPRENRTRRTPPRRRSPLQDQLAREARRILRTSADQSRSGARDARRPFRVRGFRATDWRDGARLARGRHRGLPGRPDHFERRVGAAVCWRPRWSSGSQRRGQVYAAEGPRRRSNSDGRRPRATGRPHGARGATPF